MERVACLTKLNNVCSLTLFSVSLALHFSLSGAADRVARLLAAVQNFAQLDGDQGEAVVAALNVFKGECNVLPCCSLCFCLGHKFFGMLS